MVFSMCRLVIQACGEGNEQVIEDVRRLAKYSEGELPKTAQELCNQIFHSMSSFYTKFLYSSHFSGIYDANCESFGLAIYMGMSKQSSKETRGRAKELAEAIGSYHVNIDIDEVYNAQRNLIINTLNFEPKFKVEGGSNAENLTLQNIQARTRMVTAYEFAQILPVTRQRPGGGSLLVLGSANVGESLRGYLTKYDCSSADSKFIHVLIYIFSSLRELRSG